MEAAKKADREAKAAAKAQRAAEYAKKAAAQEAAKADEEAAAKRLMKLESRLRKKLLSKRLSKPTKQQKQPKHLQRRALNSRSFACSAPKNISLRQHFRKRSEKEESRTLGALFLFVSARSCVVHSRFSLSYKRFTALW